MFTKNLGYYKRQAKRIGKEEKCWEIEKSNIERRNKMDEERRAITQEKRRITTSKFLVLFLFANCTAVQVVAIIATIESFHVAMATGMAPDMSALIALISAIVGEVIGYAVYAVKATKENMKGGITYDMAFANRNCEDTTTLEKSSEVDQSPVEQVPVGEGMVD